MATSLDATALAQGGGRQGIQIEVVSTGDDAAQKQSPMKRQRSDSPCSTAASTPIVTTTSPEARAKSPQSGFADMSVQQLKDLITAFGGSSAGMEEKTELIAYLEFFCPGPPPMHL